MLGMVSYVMEVCCLSIIYRNEDFAPEDMYDVCVCVSLCVL